MLRASFDPLLLALLRHLHKDYNLKEPHKASSTSSRPGYFRDGVQLTLSAFNFGDGIFYFLAHVKGTPRHNPKHSMLKHRTVSSTYPTDSSPFSLIPTASKRTSLSTHTPHTVHNLIRNHKQQPSHHSYCNNNLSPRRIPNMTIITHLVQAQIFHKDALLCVIMCVLTGFAAPQGQSPALSREQ